MHPLESYLTGLRTLQDAGTEETAGYPAFKALIDAVGEGLKPKVLCIIHPENLGAGIPDAAFFTADQVNARTRAIRPGQVPTGGVAEVKGPKTELDKVQVSPQVMKYLERYGQVLVSNYREFRLVVLDRTKSLKLVERFQLAGTAADFWKLAAHPQKAAEEKGPRLVEFLARVLRNKATLTEPKDVAWFFASHARDALEKIEHQDLPALAQVRKSFEDALGLTFEGEKGDHFFRSSLIQTLFYGVFSAWVLWAKDHPPPSKDPFNWRESIWTLRVPMIRALFEQVATPTRLGELGLVQILDNTGEVLNRVDRAAFFQKFQDAEAVQYFYEPFLEAFDPGLRKELGVWYTPKEVVQYMVARVDAVLREELGIRRGLADEQVMVLDPCCGTGAYLVEVLHRIGQTLKEEGGDALLASDLRKAAQERVFGFELLPAPFVVSHLQLGLLLQRLGAPLKEKDRAGVFLTNALTGWTADSNHTLPFPELEQERELAEEVKRRKKVLVILGNPPYNGFAGITESKEERELTQAYRVVKKVAKPQGQGLNDLYVRFFRMAERKIVEGTGRGIVCFISNYSWLDGLSFTGMREQFLDRFGEIFVDNLHGNRIISEYAPDGETSETIFAIAGSSPGIKIGTAIATLVKASANTAGQATVLYRDFHDARAVDRRAALLREIGNAPLTGFAKVVPSLNMGYPFKPKPVSAGYASWPSLIDLLPTSYPGIQPSRDTFLVDVDRAALERRIRRYFDAKVLDGDVAREFPDAMRSTARYDAIAIRRHLVARGLREGGFVRYLYRPMDLRWLYWEPETKLLDEKRAEYVAQLGPHNRWIAASQVQRRSFDPVVPTSIHSSRHVIERGANLFPAYKLSSEATDGLFADSGHSAVPNLSERAHAYVVSRAGDAGALLNHITAIVHSPRYMSENAGALQQDWPRIPLPAAGEIFGRSVGLGRQLTQLLDPLSGFDETSIGRKSGGLGALHGVQGSIDPEAGDLELSARWGYLGRADIVMPGQGKVADRGDHLDIYLNDRAYWANVPKPVWEYTLGGYQVIKKWLSYREKTVLGRDLTVEEARYVTEMVRRIAAILALGPRLDENYEAVKADAYEWSKR